ncbi:MAG: AraC family transcriptional regulator [Pseudomonadota bacterium]
MVETSPSLDLFLADIVINDVRIGGIHADDAAIQHVPASTNARVYLGGGRPVYIRTADRQWLCLEPGGLFSALDGQAHYLAGQLPPETMRQKLPRTIARQVDWLVSSDGASPPVDAAKEGLQRFDYDVLYLTTSLVTNPLPDIIPPRMLMTPQQVAERPALQAAVDIFKTPDFVLDPRNGMVRLRLAEIIAISVVTFATEQLAGEGLNAYAALYDSNIRAALRDMHRRPDADWTIDTLADAAGLSRSTFIRRFREATHQSPKAYLTLLRMNIAVGHLCAGDVPIPKIAEMVGFNSAAAFARAFAAVYGKTPGRYRAESRQLR